MFGTSPSSSKKMTENRPFLLGARRATQARHTVVFLVLAHDRRRILHFNVTAHPTADWTGQQLREAFPFAQLPRYLLRDRDAIFGDDFREHLRDMGICEVLSAPKKGVWDLWVNWRVGLPQAHLSLAIPGTIFSSSKDVDRYSFILCGHELFEPAKIRGLVPLPIQVFI